MFNPLSLLSKPSPASFLVLSVGFDHIKAAVFSKDTSKLEGVGRSSLGSDFLSSLKNAIEAVAAVTDKLPKETIIGIQSPYLSGTAHSIEIDREQPTKKITFEEMDNVIKARFNNQAEGKLFFSTIANSLIDSVKVPNPIGVAGNKLTMVTFNGFLAGSWLEKIDAIPNELDIDLVKILPTSFAVFKLIHPQVSQNSLVLHVSRGNTEIVVAKGEIVKNLSTVNVGLEDDEWLELILLSFAELKNELGETNTVYFWGEADLDKAKDRLLSANWEEIGLEKPAAFEVLTLRKLDLDTELDLAALAKEFNN